MEAEQQTPNVDHLPDGAQRLVAVIGLAATLRLVDRHGGKDLRLYNTGPSLALLVEAVGADAADKLLQYFGSDPFYVPKCKDALADVRNAKIHAEYDHMTQVEGRSGRDTIHRLAEKHDVSARHVWRILKKSSNVPAVRVKNLDTRQMSLI